MTNSQSVARTGLMASLAIGASAGLLAAVPDARLRMVLALLPLLGLGAAWVLNSPVRWLALFFFAALCLPPLPIELGDTGPHIALLFAALGLVAGLLRPALWRHSIPPISIAPFLLALSLAASIALAAIYSGPVIAAASFARVGLFLISIYVFYYTAAGPGAAAAQNPAVWVRGLFAAGALSALFACVDFYFQFPTPAGFGPQFIWLPSGVYRRAQGFFYEASTLGNLCTFFLTFVAVAITRPRAEGPHPVRRGWLLAGAAVLFGALILSFSRASLLNLATGLLTLAWLERRRFRFLRALPLLIGGGIVSALAVWTLAPQAVESYGIRLAATGQMLAAGQSTALSGRLESWSILGSFLINHPWHAFFGVGYKTLPYSDFTGSTIVADNAYLSALVETGLAGLLTLLFCHVAILTLAFKSARSPDRWASFFGSWIACFWAGEVIQMMSGDLLTYWRVLPLYLWTLAMAVSRSRGLAHS